MPLRYNCKMSPSTSKPLSEVLWFPNSYTGRVANGAILFLAHISNEKRGSCWGVVGIVVEGTIGVPRVNLSVAYAISPG